MEKSIAIQPNQISRSIVGLNKILKKAAIYVVLLINLVLTGYPFVWMTISSFKTNMEYYEQPWGLPKKWVFDNFVRAWNLGVKQYLWNSTYITVVTIIGLLLVASMISFYLARRPFKGSTIILIVFLFGMMIPGESTLIPLYILMKHLHWINKFPALLFPYIGFGLPTAIFLIYGFFLQLPKELDEAAMIDGCNVYQTFYKIYLPLARPILTTVTILSAFGIWNQFLFPLIFASSNASLKTIPLGLMDFRGGYQTEYATISAALVIATLPIIVLYLSLQKFIEKGIASGAVKG
jgi:raffinose/stachyose/melibiose transport system permease protein